MNNRTHLVAVQILFIIKVISQYQYSWNFLFSVFGTMDKNEKWKYVTNISIHLTYIPPALNIHSDELGPQVAMCPPLASPLGNSELLFFIAYLGLKDHEMDFEMNLFSLSGKCYNIWVIFYVCHIFPF